MHNDLYGSTSTDLEVVKSAVENSLGCKLQCHDSLYHGGDYYRADLLNGESILVKNNLDPFDGDAVDLKFPGYPILVYVKGTSRTADIKAAFSRQKPPIMLLHHK